MSALTIALTVLQVLSGLAVTVVVLMQSGKSAGLSGAIAGGADTFSGLTFWAWDSIIVLIYILRF